ncbi:MAG: VWA domain-containing protein [Thermodesulfobacteriota bacterium]
MNAPFRLLAMPMLHLLWLLPLFVLLLLYASRRRRRDLARFAGTAMLARLSPPAHLSRRRRKGLLLLGGAFLIIAALCRPAWNEKPLTVKRQGRDVVFLLDVSRSMLADDLRPNRLEQARLAIADAVNVLAGDRVALAVFAGETRILCPLTVDYGFFRLMLDSVTPEAVTTGGTRLGDALRAVDQEVFDGQAREYKDVVVITDGEDHDSFPVEAAAKVAEKGVRLIVVGIGDEKEGRRIPVIDADGNRSFLRHDGREVWTRLDGDTLKKMALATPGGRYLPVATGTIDLGQVYREFIAGARKKELEEEKVLRYDEKFQIFLGLAFILLLIDAALPDWKPQSASPEAP